MSPHSEITVRLASFAGVLLAMALLEHIAPRRRWTVSRIPRWTSNLGLVVLNALLLRMVAPVSAVAAAMFCEAHGWGALRLLGWPPTCLWVLALVAFDLAIYLQHVMFHAVPLLWRLHLVHHADLDFDATTGLRFHTLEILLSALWKLAIVAALGPPPGAVVAFEVLLNATAMFNHANVRLPSGVDRWLRWLVVTPDMHRVHHSVIRTEANSNFGFNLPWWDRFLGTYRAQPRLGHAGMTFGLAHLRDEQRVDRLPGMLLLPFLNSAATPALLSNDQPDGGDPGG